jgi:hypothetical protein
MRDVICTVLPYFAICVDFEEKYLKPEKLARQGKLSHFSKKIF